MRSLSWAYDVPRSGIHAPLNMVLSTRNMPLPPATVVHAFQLGGIRDEGERFFLESVRRLQQDIRGVKGRPTLYQFKEYQFHASVPVEVCLGGLVA